MQRRRDKPDTSALPFLADSLIGFFQIRGQPIERAFPKLAILLDPRSGLLQRPGLKFHFVHTAITPASKQSGVLEDTEMLGDGWERHGMRLGKVSDSLRAAGQMGEDPSARRVGQGGKSSVQCLR